MSETTAHPAATRLATIRQSLVARGLATDAECAAWWPGGTENPDGPDTWTLTALNYGRFLARMEQREKERERAAKSFDADAFRRDHVDYRLTLDGAEYVVSQPSAAQLIRYQARVQQAAGDPVQQLQATRWLLERLFPWPGPRWQVVRHGDPVKRLLGGPPAVLQAFLADFFVRTAGTPPPGGVRTSLASA